MGDLQRYAAANARVRTLLPSLFGRSGFETLYTYPSSAALQEAILHTRYAAAVSPGLPIEVGIRSRVVLAGRALLGLMREPERAFLRQYLLRYEMENLKLIVRAVHAAWPWPSIAPHIVPCQASRQSIREGWSRRVICTTWRTGFAARSMTSQSGVLCTEWRLPGPVPWR